ncbi:MAG: cob(I)yrinic acid a,c-diamide adenosyltransferase [Oceanospirillaceae bacterium]|nr:cob(I)yrinic acid a,c-diamide adenosyltransferase [Oceanospirillaceae bacterium]
MSDKKSPNRLDKIYTRSGDSGKTSLARGKRLYKSHSHIKTLGEVDELNCQMGVLMATLNDHGQLFNFFQKIQNTLFDLGAELAMNDANYPSLDQRFIDELELQIDDLNQQLAPLKEFILPGGHLSAAHCHLARAVCRRAERQLIELIQETGNFSQPQKYLNRLSDFLFVAARVLNQQNATSERLWSAHVSPA